MSRQLLEALEREQETEGRLNASINARVEDYGNSASLFGSQLSPIRNQGNSGMSPSQSMSGSRGMANPQEVHHELMQLKQEKEKLEEELVRAQSFCNVHAEQVSPLCIIETELGLWKSYL